MAIDTAPALDPGVAELAQTVRQEIEEFDYPSRPWTVRHAEGGHPVLDVLVIGGGQAGITAALRLRREGIRDIEVVDSALSGDEGPWTTWARMETLRTPKTLLGPEAGIRAATFRSWYTRLYGADAYARLGLVPRETWQEYLRWLRTAVGVRVTNATTVTALRPRGARWLVELAGPEGPRSVVARKVVACTGIAGAGGAAVPAALAEIADARGSLWAHSSDLIDLPSLEGRSVLVVGLGASAFDNAAAALEHGATVLQVGRRATLPSVNSLRHLESKGVFRGFAAMPDDVRLGFLRRELSLPMPPPPHSVERCQRHAGYRLRLGTEVTSVHRDGGGLRVETTRGSSTVDFVIAATGFQVDLRQVPWLAGVVDQVLLWGDVHELGADGVDRRIARYPYLDPDLSCRPQPGASPAVANLHLMNEAAHASVGPIALGINGLPWASEAVAHGIAKDLAAEDGPVLLERFLTATAEEVHAT